MTVLGIAIEPWMLRAAVVCLVVAALLALLLWYADRVDRERNAREDFERRMRGGR